MGPLAANDAEPNDTALIARDFGMLPTGTGQVVSGTVGDGPAGAADVDWYRFTLSAPARVTVGTLGSPSGDAVRAVLSLYNEALLDLPVQDVASQDGTASLSQDLPAGTYYVAVSGFGNRYFHPLLAGSGYQGETGDYSLAVTIAPLDSAASLEWVPSFQADATEGGLGEPADDTVAAAHELGDLTTGVLVQRTGVVGDDPAYNDYLLGMNGADVDLFHFQVSGSGQYRFQTEVFSGRIGSTLDPGVSLFRLDPADGLLHLVQANDNTGNATFDGLLYPFIADAGFSIGLTAGDYYLAISASGNTPDLDLGLLPGPDYGIFDPNVSHSGMGGYSTGAYVLNLMLEEDNAPPQVIAASVTDGMTLDGPPVRLTVQFDEAVNLAQLSHRAVMLTGQGTLDAVFVRGSNGIVYYPRLEAYDPASNQATFLMYDGLPTGPAELHLSGPLGLTDLADLPLAGTTADGDFVVSFWIGGQERGTNGNPLQWTWEPSHDTVAQAQNLGSLFENELAAENDGTFGIGVRRDFHEHPQTSPGDSADYYAFELQKPTNVLLTLTGADLPAGIRLELVTESEDLGVITDANSQGVFAPLAAGRYVIRVTGWPMEMAIGGYELRIASLYSSENPTPLTVGPAPALRVRLITLPVPEIAGPEAPVDTPVVRAASVSSKPAESVPGPSLPTGVLTAMAAGPVGGVTPAGSLEAHARAVAVHLPQTPPAWISSVVGKLMATLLYLAQPVAAQPAVNEEVEGAGPPPGDELRQGFSLGLPGLDDLFQYVQRAGETAVAPLMHLNGRWMHAPTSPEDVAEAEVPTADVVLVGDTPLRVGMIPTAALALAALAVLLLLPRIHTPNREELLLNARRVRR